MKDYRGEDILGPEPEKKDIPTWVLAVIAIALFIAACALSGCYTERKAQRQVDKAHNLHPMVVAKKCTDTYPCKDSVHYQTEYLQGEDIVFTDTVFEEHYRADTVLQTKYITKTVKQVDTLRDTKYIQQTDKAALRVCEGDKKKAQDELLLMTDSRDDWRLWAIIASALVALWFIWQIIKIWRADTKFSKLWK